MYVIGGCENGMLQNDVWIFDLGNLAICLDKQFEKITVVNPV
jgi:Kelch motif